MIMDKVHTKDEAVNKAIEFQTWQSNQIISLKDVINWASYFENLAREFNLEDEFLENGLI
jgi:hypothetical protein